MSGIHDSGSEFAELDHVSASAYRQSVRMGRFVREEISAELGLTSDETVRVEHVLFHLHLLHRTPGSPDLLVPRSPDAAAADLVGNSEEQIRNLQQSVGEIRSKMLSLMPVYFESRRQRNRVEAFDIINDVSTIRSLLHDQRMHCRNEILTVQPGGAQGANLLAQLRDSTLATLDRGVRLRTLYQHTARSDLIISSYVRDVTARGAEIRTTDELIDRMIIYDRELVVLPEQHLADPGRGAVLVREPNLVSFMCTVFEYMWQNATPFAPETKQPEPITDDVKCSIIRLMGKGYKDEMVARRLGMSVRTCRRHISEITEELKAASRFQAGANAALSGLLDPEPGPDHSGLAEV